MNFKQKTISEHFDVVIVGGGMTGLCAAIAAARNGAKTALVNDRPVLGGNASSEIRMHICGATANMKKPELSEGGIIHELMLSNKRINDSYNFSIWDAVLFNAVKAEKNLTVFLNTTMFDASVDRGKVQKIECYQMTTERKITLSADFFADCTGNGTLCAFVGANEHTGSEGKSEYNEPHAPEKANADRMGNTLLFKAADVGHPVKFIPPVDVIHFTEEQLKYRKHSAEIPKDILEKASENDMKMLFDGFAQDYGYWWIEIPGESDNIIEEYEDIRDQLVRAVYGIWDHIKNGGDHGADNFELVWVGMLPGVRESRRIDCDYMLNENDILENRRFYDSVAYGGWDIDNHVPKGLFDFDKIPSVVYPFEGSYNIPYRSYCVKGFDNLFVGGRCMGCSKLAMASTRVMGTCGIGGQAIGTAAALLCKNNNKNVRDIDIKNLQQTLIKDDCYIPSITNEDKCDLAQNAKITASSEVENYSVDYLTNGITRKIDKQNNLWKSNGISENGEWLKLSLEKPSKINTVQLVFNSNFDIEKKITLSSRRQKQQVLGVPKELICDYDIILCKDGKEIERKEIRGNYQRLNRVYFDNTECDTVEVRVISTNGIDSAEIFEIRIY